MRGIIIGLAVVCYTAALIITAAAVGLPVPQSTLLHTQSLPTAPEAPRRSPSQQGPTTADQAKLAPSPPTHSPVEKKASEADALLELAQKSEKAGDYRRAEEMYRESARVLRERKKPAPAPLLR